MLEHKNTILAVVLSLIVVVGWQYFIGYPQMEKQRHEQALKQEEQAKLKSEQQPGAMPSSSGPSVPAPQSTAPLPPGAAGSPGQPRAQNQRSSGRGIAAYRDRYSAVERQHRFEGRTYR